MRVLAAVVVAGFLMLAACSPVSGQLTVLGAASLAGTLDEMKTAYASTSRGATLQTSTGSSSALRTQIEQGARADVFLSADTANPQSLVDAGSVDGSLVAFATNHLTIVVPNGNPAGIASPQDLGRAGLRVIAAGDDVPITRYATQVVDKLAALPGYSTDFAAAYASNIRSREDNVGAVVSKIALGEGDAAIVYVTDAQSAGVDTVAIPAEADVVATYGGVVLKHSTNTIAAHAFLDWVHGPDGQEILANHGFSAAP